jgi:CheY-like chemotaxis protein
MFGRAKKEIKIHRKYRKNLWNVEVDQGQIEQVLLNLYVNAWQAMPGGGELFIQTENVFLEDKDVKPYDLVPGRYVSISVADTGLGMDRKIQDRIFDPFFTTKEMSRGTGLGLASAYGIIKNHGGIINVYSEKGEGSTFNIYLPASTKSAVSKKEPVTEIQRGSGTIMLVDDEEMIIDIGEQLLQRLGYKVLVAGDGKAAEEVYRTNKDSIDMVILDMVMPGIGGGETYEKLKNINPDVKVLLSSGYSLNGEAKEILNRGCSGFIQKPFNLEGLSRKIHEILGT